MSSVLASLPGDVGCIELLQNHPEINPSAMMVLNGEQLFQYFWTARSYTVSCEIAAVTSRATFSGSYGISSLVYFDGALPCSDIACVGRSQLTNGTGDGNFGDYTVNNLGLSGSVSAYYFYYSTTEISVQYRPSSVYVSAGSPNIFFVPPPPISYSLFSEGYGDSITEGGFSTFTTDPTKFEGVYGDPPGSYPPGGTGARQTAIVIIPNGGSISLAGSTVSFPLVASYGEYVYTEQNFNFGGASVGPGSFTVSISTDSVVDYP